MKLPKIIPLIKIKDNLHNGEPRYFGKDYHDSLTVSGNALHYYNLQNSCGSQYEKEGYSFVGQDLGDHMVYVELFNLAEYTQKFVDEIAILRAENERLKAERQTTDTLGDTAHSEPQEDNSAVLFVKRLHEKH